MSNTNPWKHVKIDEIDVNSNPYLNPPPKPTPVPTPAAAPVTVTKLDDFLVLENLVCVDANDNIFEQYPELRVRKDIFRDQNRGQINFTAYNAAVHCEKNGLFLPSFALTCNLVAALYQNRNNPDAEALLQQYKNHGAGYGWQAQNTIINYAAEEIIHYPTAADFGQTTAVNNGLRKTGRFTKASLKDDLLENALKDVAHTLYVKQLTGLANPADLVEIGNYFGRPAKLWFPWNGQAGATYNEKRAAWFGCSSYNLYLYGDSNLSSYNAARGVRGGGSP